MRTLSICLLLGSLVLQSGCAVFGVATRSDLEEHQRQQNARVDQMREENRILRDGIEQVRTTLTETERTLSEVESALAAAEDRAASQRQEIWSQTGDLQMRMAAVEDRIGAATTASDSLRLSLERANRVAEAASSEALMVRGDLDEVARRADLARSRSDLLLRAWLEQLRAERERLERQLTALEASLAQWESEVFETTSPLAPVPVESEDVGAATGDRAETDVAEVQ